MRVHLAGNVLNNSLMLAKELARAGIDAYAFLPERETRYAGDRPDWEYGPGPVAEDLIVRMPRVLPLMPSNFRFLRRFVRADILHVMGVGPALLASYPAPLPPVVFHPFGGDLQLMPWWRGSAGKRGVAVLQRIGIRRADFALIQPYQHGLLRRLGFRGLVRDDLPWVADFGHIARIEPDETVLATYRDFRMVVYCPSRHAYDSHPDIGPYAKNNHVGIRGFARFVRETGVRPDEICMVMVDKGPNVADSMALVEQEGLGAFTRFVPEHPKRAVYTFMRLPQVVVIDQFPEPEMTVGAITREGLFLGAPVITRSSIEMTAMQYGSTTLPILYAGTPDEVAMQLRSMWDESRRRRHREAVAAWSAAHLSDNSRLTNGLKEIYATLLQRRGRARRTA